MRRKRIAVAVILFIIAIGGYAYWFWKTDKVFEYVPRRQSGSLTLIEKPKTPADKIVNGAKTEVIARVRYNAEYLTIPYPNGDVPRMQGACTDVVIRALRYAGYDLQQLVHEDMSRNFSRYPKKWGMKTTDANIDHRRVPNLMAFFTRFGKSLTTIADAKHSREWNGGDIVCWELGKRRATHIGVLSNERNGDGLPFVLHNMGPTTTQEDCLNKWKIIGHYRYPG